MPEIAKEIGPAVATRRPFSLDQRREAWLRATVPGYFGGFGGLNLRRIFA
jgi:hypothetical protein